jgi:hypothetical protein
VNPDGNRRLTAAVGVLLLAPVLLEIATVLLGVHTFMSWHVFVGIALIPLVVLKLVTTGWRFARYYTRSRAYVAHGPPQAAMRLLAPLFVVATVVLFGSGVAMGAAPRTRTPARPPAPWPGVGDLARPPRAACARLSRTGVERHGRRCPAGRPDARAREDGPEIRVGDRSRLRPGAGRRTRSGPAPVDQHPARPQHRNEGQSAARNRPFSQAQSQRPQFSTTGIAKPVAAVWTRRIDPP